MATPQYTSEEISAQNDHDAVSSWVAQCMGVLSVHNLPNEFVVAFNAGDYLVYVTDPRTKPNRDYFTAQEQEVIALSRDIYVQRSNLDKSTLRSSHFVTTLQLVVIAIGFATTALVSISSADIWKIETKPGRVIRVLAIVFPALGTAVAALSAVYPRDELSRSSAVLTSLGQLHAKIGIEVWGLQCLAQPSPNPDSPWAKNATKIDGWITRYQQVLNPPEPSSARSTATETKPSDQTPAPPVAQPARQR